MTGFLKGDWRAVYQFDRGNRLHALQGGKQMTTSDPTIYSDQFFIARSKPAVKEFRSRL